MAQLEGFIALGDVVAGGESLSVVRRYLVSCRKSRKPISIHYNAL